MTEPTAAHPFPPISRWSTEARSKAAQDNKLMRFLLESAFFDGNRLAADWQKVHPDTKRVNTVLMAQSAGYRTRNWTHGIYVDLLWRYPKPPKPKPVPVPKPGVSKADIARTMGVTSEAVRLHSLRPCFPRPIRQDSSLYSARYDAAEIEAYYLCCAEVAAANRSVGITRAQIATTYGVTYNAVAEYAKGALFPLPIGKSATSLIYDRGEVAAFFRAARHLHGPGEEGKTMTSYGTQVLGELRLPRRSRR